MWTATPRTRFVSPVTAPDGTKHVLQETISSRDWFSSTPNFSNTQGRKYDLPAKTYSLTISVYIPSSYGTTNGRMAGFWATALDYTGAVEAYPVIEFQGPITSDAGGPGYYNNSGVAGFYGFDTTNGGFVHIGLPTNFKYNTWVQLTMTLLQGSGYTYTVTDSSGRHGASVTIADLSGASLANVILQGYNYDTTYSLFWNSLTSTASH